MFYAMYEDLKPKRKTRYSAGFDIKSRISTVLMPNEIRVVPTGVYINRESEEWQLLKEEAVAKIYIRSSLAKNGLVLANGVGVVDLDYPDEIGVMVYNLSGDWFQINKHMDIAQIVVEPHFGAQLHTGVKKLDALRTGGFGSTDKKEFP